MFVKGDRYQIRVIAQISTCYKFGMGNSIQTVGESVGPINTLKPDDAGSDGSFILICYCHDNDRLEYREFYVALWKPILCRDFYRLDVTIQTMFEAIKTWFPASRLRENQRVESTGTHAPSPCSRMLNRIQSSERQCQFLKRRQPRLDAQPKRRNKLTSI